MAAKTFRPRNGSYNQIINQATRRVETLPVVFYEQIPKELRTIAFTVSGIERMTTIEKVLESLNDAFDQNISFKDWQDSVNLDELIDLSNARRETIYRTFMTTEYNRGRVEVGLDTDNDLNWLMYQAILDDRTRPNHAANDGITRRADDEFWETNLPPLGFNCRCFVLNLGRQDAETTPLAQLSDPDLQPDEGWNYNKTKPIKSLNTYYRDKQEIFTKTIREASTNRLLLRTQDEQLWYEKYKKQFTKDEN